MFAAYASRHGHAFIDRALYLPKSWTDDPARLAAVHVPIPMPGGVTFATKPRLAVQMIRRAIAARVPFHWVAADSVYGVGEVEQVLRRAGKGYVLGVSSAHRFNSWGKMPRVGGTALAIATACEPSDWQRLSAGAGTKGPRLHDWCYLELADLQGGDDQQPDETLWTRGLLIRRRVGDSELAFFSTWCPKGTPPMTPKWPRWSGWRASAGASRTASKPPRTNSASIITRPDPGMDGTVTLRWSCWPSP